MTTTTTIHERRPFNLRYIVRQPDGINPDEQRMTHRTASCNYRYIMRQNGVDEFGPTPDFASRGDLFDHGRCAPIAGNADAYKGIKLWEAADEQSRERRPALATAMHAVGTLPHDGDRLSWRAAIEGVCEDNLASRGMIVDWAIHLLRDGADGFKILPHCHLQVTSRIWRDDRDLGRHQRAWLSTKASVDRLGIAWYESTGLYPHDYRKSASS